MEVEVAAEPEATAMEMATVIAMGTVTETAMGMVMDVVTETAMGMVMDVVTETAMEMVMDVGTEVAMEMVTEMAMCLVVEEVEGEEAPEPVVAEVGVEEEEAVAVGAEAALVEVVVAEVVVDMNFALGSRIVQVLMWCLSFSGHVASTASQHTTTSMLHSFSAELCA
jgi:hypothetical protein